MPIHSRRNHHLLSVMIVSSFLALYPPTALAQTRTENDGKSNILRSWPQSGAWRVVLSRKSNSTFRCNLLSYKGMVGNGYIVGLVQSPTQLSVYIADFNPRAVAGDDVRMLVDDVTIGVWKVGMRTDAPNAAHSILAPIATEDENARVISLFRTGGSAKFKTDNVTYTIPLAGADVAMSQMKACVTEAATLDAARTSAK